MTAATHHEHDESVDIARGMVVAFALMAVLYGLFLALTAGPFDAALYWGIGLVWAGCGVLVRVERVRGAGW